MHSFQLSIWCKADAPSQRLARVLPLFRRRPVHILLRRKTVITLTLRPGSFYTKERSVILLKQPIGIAAANRHVQLSTSGNLEFLLFSVDQFSNLGRFSGQNFEIALLWPQAMRPVLRKFALISGVVPRMLQDLIRQHTLEKAALQQQSGTFGSRCTPCTLIFSIPQSYVLYHSDVPEPILIAEAATQRAVKAAESLSADLVEVANSGAAKVSLKRRILTVRPLWQVKIPRYA